MSSVFGHAQDAVYKTLELPEVSINWLAIIAATAAVMAIGAVWYGPLLGSRWMKLVKLSKKDTENNWQKPMFIMLVMAIFQAVIIKHFIVYTDYFYPAMSDLSIGIFTGFWLFAGVAMPLIISNNMFAMRPTSLSYIEAGYSLVSLITIGVILSLWT